MPRIGRRSTMKNEYIRLISQLLVIADIATLDLIYKILVKKCRYTS